jgi:hypothetical protein
MQLLSVYSTKTKSNFNAVLTTSLNLDEIKLYNHWMVWLWSITPFIPSTYSITCPNALKM